MDTISSNGLICPYGGTAGPVIFSAAAPPPGTLGTTWKRQVENSVIEPTTVEGVLTTKPFTCSKCDHKITLFICCSIAASCLSHILVFP